MTHTRRLAATAAAAAIALLVTAAAAQAVTWKRVNTGTAEQITAIEYRSPAQLWFTTSAGHIFTRLPNGTFAVQGNFPGRQFNDIQFRPSGDVGLAVADTGQIFRFVNGQWAQASVTDYAYDSCPALDDPPFARVPFRDNVVAVGWGSDNIAWAIGAGDGEILETVDAGATWSDVSHLADGNCRVQGQFTDVATVPGSATDAYFLDQFGNPYRTADGMASNPTKLTDMNDCLTGLTRVAIDPASPNRIAAAGGGNCNTSLAFSGDSGSTSRYVGGLGGKPLREIAAAPGVFIAAGDDGTIRRTFDGLASDSIPARGALRHEDWLAVDLADRAHAAVGGDNGALALSGNVDPRPAITVGTLRARRSRVRVAGRLRVPRGIAKVAACQGTVRVTVKRGHRSLARRGARVRPSCRFSTTVRLSRRRVGRAHRLTVVVRFTGNAQLGARQRTLRVRVR